jgi:hypothetical protein
MSSPSVFRCFVCSDTINFVSPDIPKNNKITLCSSKCVNAFKETLPDEKEREKSESFYVVNEVREQFVNQECPENIQPPIKKLFLEKHPGTNKVKNKSVAKNLFDI